MTKGALLMIVHRIPYPPDKGDKIRSFNQLKYLAEQGWQVHLCALADDPDDLKHIKELEKYCASVVVQLLVPKLEKIRSLVAPLCGLPISARYFYNSKLQQRVDEVLHKGSVVAVLCFCSPMAEYLRRSSARPLAPGGDPKVRYVMDLVDVDSDKWGQYAEHTAAPLKWVYALESRLLKCYEQHVAEDFHATLLVSFAEAEDFRRRTGQGTAIHAVSNGVDLEFFHTSPARSAGKPLRITFCGAMSYLPNVDAVTWFAREVLPLIQGESLAEVEFCIVGGGGGDAVLALGKLPGVRVTGRVDDVRPFVWDSDLSVAPIRIARGIQNKVLEAMSMGVAALITPQAFEGMEAQAGRDLYVVPAEPQVFARAALELLRDPERRSAMALSARKLVEAKYTWQGRLQLLDQLLSGEPAELPAPRAAALS